MVNIPQARKDDLVVSELETELLIYDLKINKAYCLNQTSSVIWQLCDGTKTVAEISKSLSAKLNQAVTEDLVWLALDGFKRDNLLENNEQFEINFNGLSRRQVIKKAGLASMVLLPLVSSLVVPTAAMAQSGGSRAYLAACSSSGQCSSGNCAAGPPNPPTCCVAGATQNISPGTQVRAQGKIDSCANYPTSASIIAALPFPSNQCCSNSLVGTCSNVSGSVIVLQINCA